MPWAASLIAGHRALTRMAPIASLPNQWASGLRLRSRGPLSFVGGLSVNELVPWLGFGVSAAGLATTWLLLWVRRCRPIVQAAWQDQSEAESSAIVVTIAGREAPTSITSVRVKSHFRSVASFDLYGPALPAKLEPGQILTYKHFPTGGIVMAWSKAPLVAVVTHSLSKRRVLRECTCRGPPIS